KHPATLEFFHARKVLKSGLRSQCKICDRKDQATYRKTQQGKLNHNLSAAKRRKTIAGHLRNIFGNILYRCGNIKCRAYKYYGGRGIQNKFKSSDEFVDYVINVLKVDPRGLQIDRIDNNGHYEKGNIRFVTCKENCNNKRRQ
ncbi:unnamed protein product, partial [marine sediment metagenome]